MTEIDERIVELRFENKQFEQETAKTMSTLDKLKEKLQFKNASSGVDELQKAVAKINVNPIIQGIGTIETKMSTLGIAGKRVIENLTDWAMSGISKVYNKLQAPLNQIVSGGKSRALNIEQAKFQLEGLGVEWSAIQEDISYGVQDTAYGLDAAAKVASQLVASQVELGDEMKHALLGISGVAAMTNSSYDDIGRIYTTVAGNGRLMGEQLLQLSSRGINAAAQLGKALNKTESEVRDMVTKGQISFKMFSEAMFESFGEHAKSANKTFTGALSNTKAALSRLGADVAAQGFNTIRDMLNEIIPKLKEFKNGMKPAEEAIIKMVDAVGKLVQAFIKAVDIKAIVKKISPVIEKAANSLTDFAMAYELVFTNKHTKHNDAAFFAEQRGLEQLKETTNDVTSAMEDLYTISDKQKEMAEAIWKEGAFGNGQARIDALGKDYNIVQAYVEKMIELGWDEGKMNEFLTQQEKDHEKAVEDTARAYKKKAFVENLTKVFGNLKHVLKNVGESIRNILSVAFSSLGEAFNGKTLMDGIVKLTDKLADLSDRFKITEKRAEKLRPVFDALFTVMKFVGRAFINATTYAGKFISFLAKVINKVKDSKIMKSIFDALKDSIDKVADAMVTIFSKLKENGMWSKFVDILKVIAVFLGERIVDAFHLVGTVAAAVGEGAVDIFSNLVGKIKDLGDNAKEGHPWLQKIVDFFKEDVLHGSWLEKLKELMTDIFGTGKDVFTRAFDIGSDFINGLVKGLKNLSLEDVERITKIFTSLMVWISTTRWIWSMVTMNKNFSKITEGLDKLLVSLTTTVNKYGKKADADRFKSFATSIAVIVGSFIALAVTYATLEYLHFDAGKIYDVCKNLVGLTVIVVGAIMVLLAYFDKAHINQVQGNKSFAFLPQLKIPAFAATVLAIGYMMQALVRAVMTVYNLIRDENFDRNAWTEAEATIGVILTVLLVFTGIAMHMSKAISGFGGFALMIFSLGVTLQMALSAIKKTAKLVKDYSPEQIEQAFHIVEALLITLLSFATIITIINKLEFSFGDKFTVNSASSPVQSNPFKGMFGMFIGLAALIRLGLLPFLETLMSVKSASDVHAIDIFIKITTSLLAFVGILTVLLTALSKTYNLTGNQANGASSSILAGGASSGPLWGLAATVASLALMFNFIAKAIKSLDGIDESSLKVFKNMVQTVLIIIGVLELLVSVGSVVAGPVVIAAFAALAAVLLSLGVAFLGAGYGFKASAEGLTELANTLPYLVDSLKKFFDDLEANKETLIQGMGTLVYIISAALMDMLVMSTEGMIEAVPKAVHNLTVALVAAIDQLANDMVTEGPEFVEALNNLTHAFAYLMVYASENSFDWIKDDLKKLGAKTWAAILSGLPHSSGKDDFTSYIDDSSLGGWSAMEIKEEVEKSTEESFKYTTAYIQEQKSKQKNNSANYLLELETYTDLTDVNLTNNKFIKTAMSKFGLDLSSYDISGLMNNMSSELGSQLSSGLGVDSNMLMDAIKSGDFGAVSEQAGFDINYDLLSGMVQAGNEEGPEVLKGYLDMYGSIDQISLDQANDMSTYATGGWTNYENAVKDKKETVCAASKEVMDAVVEELNRYYDKWYDAGRMLPEGLAEGAHDGVAERKAVSNIADVVTLMQEEVKKVSKSHSPSRVFAELGGYFTMGLAQGVLDLAYLAEDASEEVGEKAINSLRSILDRIFDTTMEGLDTNPVITPILDLDQLEAGLTNANDILNRRSSFGLAFSAGSQFNKNLAAKNMAAVDSSVYDGSNVVDAVNGLRNDINGIKDTLGSIGFYVDGRQMATAIADPMHKELNDINVRTGRGVR